MEFVILDVTATHLCGFIDSICEPVALVANHVVHLRCIHKLGCQNMHLRCIHGLSDSMPKPSTYYDSCPLFLQIIVQLVYESDNVS